MGLGFRRGGRPLAVELYVRSCKRKQMRGDVRDTNRFFGRCCRVYYVKLLRRGLSVLWTTWLKTIGTFVNGREDNEVGS